jgi:hypothetical protein
MFHLTAINHRTLQKIGKVTVALRSVLHNNNDNNNNVTLHWASELVLTAHLLDGQNRLVVVANLPPKIKKRKINAVVTLNNACNNHIENYLCSIYLLAGRTL